jgi:putative tricarboxylic transport membrane protein
MRRDLICSLVLLVVAVGYYIAASRIGRTALADAVGPTGLPRVYAGALAGLAVAIGLTAWLRHRVRAKTEPAGPTAAHQLARAAGAVAIGVVYLAIVAAIGYPFAIALMLAAMAVYQGERLSLRLVLVAAAGAAALFVLFDLVLGVTMPAPWNG